MDSILDKMKDEFGVDYTDNPLETEEGYMIDQKRPRLDIIHPTLIHSTSFYMPDEPFSTPIHLIEVENLNIKSLDIIFDDIVPDAYYMLKENLILSQITERIGRIIREIVNKDDRIEISLYSDVELPDWNDFTISVKVRNRTFEERISLWKKIEEELDSILDEMKATSRQYIAEIDSINRNLTVIVEEF